MAVVEGTNAGFVTEAPVVDPVGSNLYANDRVRCTLHQAPGDGTVIEIGMWINSGTEAATVEFGIYEDDAGEPGALLEKCTGFAKGTAGGIWIKDVTFNTPIVNGEYYWLAWSMTDTATATYTDNKSGETARYEAGQTSLENPWETGSDSDSGLMATLYALYEEPSEGTNMQINIGDAWKEVAAITVNVGDAWKAVAGAQINIGDAWKTIF